MSAASRLRKLLRRDDHIMVCPGVYDGLTARIALRDGFDCLYTVRLAARLCSSASIAPFLFAPLTSDTQTGAGTAASRLGMPDLGVATMNDMLANAVIIASLGRRVPLIADADTGYGGPVVIARTVKAYITAGVAGLHLEDQVLSKRCGHLLGKEIVDEETFISRIRAAVLAREEMKAERASDIVLIARTDALQVVGFDEALRRLEKVIEAGADVVFLEGPTTVEQCKQACERLAPTPVLLNMVAGGVTPNFTADEAKKLDL